MKRLTPISPALKVVSDMQMLVTIIHQRPVEPSTALAKTRCGVGSLAAAVPKSAARPPASGKTANMEVVTRA